MYGGADFGEVRAVAEAIGDGDDTAYYDAWNAAGDRLKADAGTAITKGHVASARALYLRASAFYATSFHPLFGAPVDPRLLAAFRKQVAALDHGLALGPNPVRPVRIPCDGMALPAYLIPAQGFESAVRPLIILNNGYDCTITDTYFASAVAASRRGYHALLFRRPRPGRHALRTGRSAAPRLGRGYQGGGRFRHGPTDRRPQAYRTQRLEPRRFSCPARRVRRGTNSRY